MGHKILVTGHLCLDLHPDLRFLPAKALTTPGKVFEIGNLKVATGGSVSNTGLTLHKLGVKTCLLTCVGDDLVGQMILKTIKNHDPLLIQNIVTLLDQPGSYTLVLATESQDRTLIHFPGTNEIFGIHHMNFELLNDCSIFHLGYPPLLPRLIADEGQELEMLYSKVKAGGVITSLDLSLPDPEGNAGNVNWLRILERVLPYVDVFLPSIEEIVFMLRNSDYENWNGKILPNISIEYLQKLAFEILESGVAITGFKLGEMGFYLQTSQNLKRLQVLENLIHTNKWCGVNLWHPSFEVDVQGTTGAGDSAYGGFLTELLYGSGPYEALRMACAVGACNVEQADAASGILHRSDTLARVEAGWPMSSLKLPG